MNDCMIIRGAVVGTDGNESVFRPATRSPGMHWAYQLIDQYSHLLNISLKWIDGEPMVTLTKTAKEESENAFKHVMEFAKRFGLDITYCRRECDVCSGHSSCATPFTVINYD